MDCLLLFSLVGLLIQFCGMELLSLLDLTVISYKGVTHVNRWAQPSMGGSKPQKQPTNCSNEHH